MAPGSQISEFLRHFYGWIRSFCDLSHSLLLFVLSELLSPLLVPLQSCSCMRLEGKQGLSCNRGRTASWESIRVTGLCNMGHAYTEWLGNFGSKFKLLRRQGKFQFPKITKDTLVFSDFHQLSCSPFDVFLWISYTFTAGSWQGRYQSQRNRVKKKSAT